MDGPSATAGLRRRTARAGAPTICHAPQQRSRTCTTTRRTKRDTSIPTSTRTASYRQRLTGAHRYTVTFASGQTPPVNGFWSLTVYNKEHFFEPNKLNRFSLGTKSKL